ncbi:MAG: hypothetical protein ACP5N1_06955 [Candidatus Woesearchaeota archaeon]
MDLEDKAKQWYNRAKKGLNNLVDQTLETANKIDESIQEQGGYTAFAKKTFNNTIADIKNAYQTLDEKITTNGEYDKEKINALLKDGTKLAEQYGKKTGQALIELSKTIGSNTKSTWNEYAITDEDWKRYNELGIGTSYNGLILKPHYEKCIEYMKHADAVIPKNVKNRRAVIQDIQISASRNLNDLLDFYSEKRMVDDKTKSAIIDKYLRTEN